MTFRSLIRLRRRLVGLGRDVRGLATIELAFVAPMLLLLMLGTIDVSQIVAAQLDLEQAAQRTTDFALSVPPPSQDGSALRQEAMAAAGVPLENVTVELYLECDGVRQANFLAPCQSQIKARFVRIVIVDQVETIFDWGALSAIFGERVLPALNQVSGDSLVRYI